MSYYKKKTKNKLNKFLWRFFSGKNVKYPEAVHVNICGSNDKTCVIKVGQTIQFDLIFVATVNAEKVTPRIEAYWTWLLPSKYLEIAQEDQNACNSITTLDGAPGCPVIAGQKYKYKMKVPVNSLPITGINVDVTFDLVSNRGSLSCFLFNASLRSK